MCIEDKELIHQIMLHLINCSKILLSYSGGLDSTVLLDILTYLNNNKYDNEKLLSFRFRVIHINHGFSKYSNIWANHCAQQCKIRNVPYKIVRVNCYGKELNEKKNIEATARYFRYKTLFNALDKNEVLLTAHHMDDQIETFFLALKRGSGLVGLSGMKQDMLFYDKYRLIRPLLNFSRTQLEKYAHNKNLKWIEDDMNQNVYFDRNFLRIKILPLLNQRWPFFNKVVARTIMICRKQEILLSEFLLENLSPLIDSDGSLCFEPLLRYSTVKTKALLRCWLMKIIAIIPSYKVINCIWKEVVLSRKDAMPKLRIGQNLCCRFHKRLYILPIEMISFVKKISIFWIMTEKKIILPYNLGLLISECLNSDNDESLNIFFKIFKKPGKILTHCLIRSPQKNEKVLIYFGRIDGLLYPDSRRRGRCLKKIWNELKIPPWIRSRIPLLFYNKTLIAAIGMFVTQNGKIKNKQDGIHKISWIQSELYYNFFKNHIRMN